MKWISLFLLMVSFEVQARPLNAVQTLKLCFPQYMDLIHETSPADEVPVVTESEESEEQQLAALENWKNKCLSSRFREVWSQSGRGIDPLLRTQNWREEWRHNISIKMTAPTSARVILGTSHRHCLQVQFERRRSAWLMDTIATCLP